MNATLNSTVGSIVANNYRSAGVFSNHGIDFCCKGGKTIDEVCRDKNLNPILLLEELQKAMSASQSGLPDFKSWPADLLVDYIEKKHHRYVSESTPVLKAYLEKIASVHGKNHPELFQILEEFNECEGALSKHMKKEELILFPYIRKMYNAIELQRQVSAMSFDFVEEPIKVMHEEHDSEGERFRRISYLSKNYTAPEDACATYVVTYRMLADFENDLHLHIHLENNVLFPMAIEMEQRMQHEPAH